MASPKENSFVAYELQRASGKGRLRGIEPGREQGGEIEHAHAGQGRRGSALANRLGQGGEYTVRSFRGEPGSTPQYPTRRTNDEV